MSVLSVLIKLGTRHVGKRPDVQTTVSTRGMERRKVEAIEPTGASRLITAAYRIATRRSDDYHKGDNRGLGIATTVLLVVLLCGLLILGFLGAGAYQQQGSHAAVSVLIQVSLALVTIAVMFKMTTALSNRAFSQLTSFLGHFLRLFAVFVAALGVIAVCVALVFAFDLISTYGADKGNSKPEDFAAIGGACLISVYFTSTIQKLAPPYLSATRLRTGVRWQLWLRWVSLLSITLVIVAGLGVLLAVNDVIQLLVGGSMMAILLFWAARTLSIREDINKAVTEIQNQLGRVIACCNSGAKGIAQDADKRAALLGLIDAFTDPKLKILSGRPYSERCDSSIVTVLQYIAIRIGCGVRTTHLNAYEKLLDSHLGGLRDNDLEDELRLACILWRDQLANESHSCVSPLKRQ